MTTAERQVAFASENERLLEKLRDAGTDVRSFEGWKHAGKWVRRGEKQRAFRVQSGARRVGIDPITGEDRYEPCFKFAYGFTAEQVK